MSTALAVSTFSLPDPQAVRLAEVVEVVIPKAIEWRRAAWEAKSLPSADELRRQLAAFEKYVHDRESRDLVAAESRRTEVVIGALLGPGAVGHPPAISPAGEIAGARLPYNDAYKFRLLAKYESRVEEWLGEGLVSRSAILGKIKRLEERPVDGHNAMVALAPWQDWLPEQPECDLLLTDPPYMTDIDEPVGRFAARWLPVALGKVKRTGRAYVCIGAYPQELAAYLAVPGGPLVLENVLVWHYRNTLGPTPDDGYKQTWQAVLHYRGPEAPPLDFPKMTEQWDVVDMNAPDGRLGERDHPWQKPDGLPERFLRHATGPGDLVLDPFAGTGTFVLAAARRGRRGRGCDNDPEMVRIAKERGCRVGGE